MYAIINLESLIKGSNSKLGFYVENIVEFDHEPPPGLMVKECPEFVTIGYVYIKEDDSFVLRQDHADVLSDEDLSEEDINTDELVEISVVQERNIKLISDKSEEIRGKFITNNSGQIGTYLLKLEEARNFLSETSIPVLGTYPFLESEADAIGSTITEVANSIIEANALWTKIASTIEAIRLKYKKKIVESLDIAEIREFRNEAVVQLDFLETQYTQDNVG